MVFVWHGVICRGVERLVQRGVPTVRPKLSIGCVLINYIFLKLPF